MSPISGWLNPEAAPPSDAVFAKLAAPGMCNAADDDTLPQRHPVPGRHPSRHPQRSGSATTTPCSPPPAPCWRRASWVNTTGYRPSIIVTTTLQELEAGAGRGLTGGGTLLPMSDVIRLASHAHHYLAIFDNGKALALYHTKRLASPAQRIVLYARDRGCTFPGCTMPAYLCEVHHDDPYATNPVTDVNTLTFGLRPQPRSRRTRLDHPQKRPRPHRMAPTRTPRPRTTPHQHLPPPRKTAPG